MSYSDTTLETIQDTIKRQVSEWNQDKFWKTNGDFLTAMNKLAGELSKSVSGIGTDMDTIQEIAGLVGWYGPLQEHMTREDVEEVIVNSPSKPFLFQVGGKLYQSSYTVSAEWLEFMVRVLRQRRGLRSALPARYTGAMSNPPLRYTWVSAVFGVNGATLYLRKFRRYPLTLRDQMASENITWEVAQFLDAIVRARLNILVSGGSGAGKTTLLTTMGLSIPETERVVAVEDEHEIHLSDVLPNFVAFELNPEEVNTTMSDLLRHVGLKVAPDRVLVGEVRGREAFDLMQAMNTGVDGSMATIHANSPADALKKWADYVTMADISMPPDVIYSRIADVHPVVVQINRLPNGKRQVTGIAECLSAARNVFETAMIFERNKSGMVVRTSTPFSEALSSRFAEKGITFYKTYEEFVQAMKQQRSPQKVA